MNTQNLTHLCGGGSVDSKRARYREGGTALVGSSTHDFIVRTDPIMRRLGKARMPWARGVMLPLGARLSNGTSGFFLGAGGGSRTHFSHPFLDAYYGLLRDVSAARRLSRSAFGGQCQPRPRSPRQF